MADEYKPYVSPDEEMKELTIPPLVLGAILAVVLGAANTYLGLKAGMTVAATFPAAVISMAVLRLFRGNILEENIARTTGAVGEALAAGAIFTIPAFVIIGAWKDISWFSPNWFLATALLLVGGILGVLLMILLRRTFMEDASLPFPESAACTEIVKAGQGGQTGAGSVFAAMGVAGLLEFFTNPNGVAFIGGHKKGAFQISESGGAFPYFTPEPSPAFLAVGYIIGPKYGAMIAAGGVLGWMFLMPLLLFMMSASDAGFAGVLGDLVARGDWSLLWAGTGDFVGLKSLYNGNIKMIAIGAMIVGAFFTLFKMRDNLITGIGRSVKSLGGGQAGAGVEIPRTDKDLNIKGVFFAILLMTAAMFGLYMVLCQSVGISLIMTIVMLIMAFLFAAVAGFLVAIIGSSSNPISGLTLSTLLISAGLLVALGMGGSYLADGVTMSEAMKAGVLAVLGVATVVCCVAGVAGDMAQDWKVGWSLGGTPWRMEVGGFVGVIAAALVLVGVITLLHETTEGGIGGDLLPAPQAGLMAVTAKGIISGAVEWPLILMGMLLAVGLICVGVASPMLVAVGMYLPFPTIMAIFAGGVIQWIGTLMAKKRGAKDKKQFEDVSNKGLLVASGFVAGQALMGILLAILVSANVTLFADAPAYKWLGGLVILFLAYYIIQSSLKALKKAA